MHHINPYSRAKIKRQVSGHIPFIQFQGLQIAEGVYPVACPFHLQDWNTQGLPSVCIKELRISPYPFFHTCKKLSLRISH